MGRFLILAGMLYIGGSVVYCVSEYSKATARYDSVGPGSSFGEQVQVGFETGYRHGSLMQWLFINLLIGSTVMAAGASVADSEDRQNVKESEPPGDDVPVDPLAELPDRRGNPFKRGHVSDIVIPRAKYTGPKNVFRKTIERPNSDGY